VFAAVLLQDSRVTPQQRSLWLICAGIVMVMAGFLWSVQFPLIKGIWTSSFALVAAGYSLLPLGGVHHVVDVWKIRSWAAIFTWIGANAITLYFVDGVVGFGEFATRFVGGDVGGFLDQQVAPGTARFLAAGVG